MKRTLLLFGASLTVVTAIAQTQPAENLNPLDAQLFRPLERRPGVITAPPLIEKVDNPNVVAGNRVVYSGSAVRLAKTRNPVELINPATTQPGSIEDNVARDPMNGRFTGWKLFAINF